MASPTPKSPVIDTVVKNGSVETPPQSPKRPCASSRERPSNVKDLQEKLLSSSSSPKRPTNTGSRESSPTKAKKSSTIKKSLESQSEKNLLPKKKASATSNVKQKKSESIASAKEPPTKSPVDKQPSDTVKENQVAEPVVETVTEPISGPVVEQIIEPVSEPVTQPVAAPVSEPVTDPVTETVIETVSETATETAPLPELEPQTDTTNPPPQDLATTPPLPPPTSPSKQEEKIPKDNNQESEIKIPQSETLPQPAPRSRAPFSWLKGSNSSSPKRLNSNSNSNSPTRKQSPSSISEREPPTTAIDNYELIQNRATSTLKVFNQLTPIEAQCVQQGLETLRLRYEEIKPKNQSCDWSIWTCAVNDYQGLAAESPASVAQAVAAGIPPPIRGLVWQVQTRSKSRLLEETYTDLLTQLSPHEKSIRKDISRTPLFRIANSESLFNLLKAYSLYDPEVGYTQGMAFIAVPILINNVSEPEAFSLLVTLMKNYKLRDLYTVEMPGLQVKLYQYDRILEDTAPELHIHLQRQGIRSSMYASQWILTLFAYKFPLEIIVRIFDTVVAEGLASVLRFSVALMKANREKILMLEFDPLLNFLKDRLFDVYLSPDQHGISQHHTFANLLRTNNSTSYDNCTFQVDQLVKDAFAVKLFPKTLSKYQAEYIEIHRQEKETRDEIDRLRSTNSQLASQVRKLEESLDALNREHVQLANNMIQGKVQIDKLQDELEQSKTENKQLSALVEGYRKEPPIEKAEMDRLLQRNLEVMDINRNLEDQLSLIEQELANTNSKVAHLESENGSIKNKWNDIRKLLD